jgi:hypothetical protein
MKPDMRRHADQERNLLSRIKSEGPLRPRGHDRAWVYAALRRLVAQKLVQRDLIGYVLTPGGWLRVKELEGE